jgi:hypothetical protein
MNLRVGRPQTPTKHVHDEGEGFFRCIASPVPGPNLFGLFDTNIVFGIPNGFGHNAPTFSIVLMGSLLLLLSYRVRVLTHTPFEPNIVAADNVGQLVSTSRFVGLYIGITGVFFFTLFTNLNIVVVVMAGLHNLLEWGILCSLLNNTLSARKYFAASVVWIWVVWWVVMEIPDLFLAFGFEELAGLWPDWVLVIYAYHLCTLNRGPYDLFFEATLWHMLQIFTLLGQGFGFLSSALATKFSYFTALPNYWYYSEFAVSLVYPAYNIPFPRILSHWPFPPAHEHADGVGAPLPHMIRQQPQNGFHIMVAGLALSAICVAGPPIALGESTYFCHVSTQVRNVVIWQAFVKMLATLAWTIAVMYGS